MNAERFMDMLNLLPDDMIVSAVCSKHERRRNSIFLISTIAACLVAGVTAIIYPKLKVQPPEIREPDVTVTETTAVSSTTGTETGITTPSTISVSTTFSESSISTVSTASPTVSTAQTTTSEFAALTFTTVQRTTTLTQTTENLTITTVQRTKASTQTPTETSALKTHDTEPVRTTTTLVTGSIPNTTTLLPVSTVPSTTEQTTEFTSYYLEHTHGTAPETTAVVTESAPISVTEVNSNTWIVPEWIRFHKINGVPEPQPPPFCEVSCRILSGEELEDWQEKYEISNISNDFLINYDILFITFHTNIEECRVTEVQFTENALELQIIYSETLYFEHDSLVSIPIPHSLTLDRKDIILHEETPTYMEFLEMEKDICNLILK